MTLVDEVLKSLEMCWWRMVQMYRLINHVFGALDRFHGSLPCVKAHWVKFRNWRIWLMDPKPIGVSQDPEPTNSEAR